MNLVTGTLIEIRSREGDRTGRLSVGGAVVPVALDLVPAARVGDALLAHAGVAIAVLRESAPPLPLEES
jgi:hydrogenase maturation factor